LRSPAHHGPTLSSPPPRRCDGVHPTGHGQ
jgi:hypothetical protein